jgi:hypothetical protein
VRGERKPASSIDALQLIIERRYELFQDINTDFSEMTVHPYPGDFILILILDEMVAKRMTDL